MAGKDLGAREPKTAAAMLATRARVGPPGSRSSRPDDSMGARSPDIDAFVSRAGRWQGEIRKLRSILLSCGLDEDLKWGKPCYMLSRSNLAIIPPFKEHCSLMFFKGALLEDPHGLLRRPGENTQSALRLEFTGEAGIKKTVIRSYVEQAIAVEEGRARGRLQGEARAGASGGADADPERGSRAREGL